MRGPETKFRVLVSEAGVRGLEHRARGGRRSSRLARLAERELRAYFAGRLRTFSVPCDLSGLSPFARKVLELACEIPYGEVRTYQWLASKLGRPKAARAVGGALARNPVPILIPCHRVVRADGKLGPFVLGSDWKRRLLDLEKSALKSAGSSVRSRVR